MGVKNSLSKNQQNPALVPSPDKLGG